MTLRVFLEPHMKENKNPRAKLQEEKYNNVPIGTL